MMKELFISVVGQEAQAAVVEDEKLLHFFTESIQEKSLVGNIYLGTVVRVLPGMQAAFVEINLERTAFLHVQDIVTTIPNPTIESLVHEGKQLVVQVLKDPLGSKGARLTTELSFPSTYLVYRPYEKQQSLSQKIEDKVERERITALLTELPLQGLIVRTAAEGQSLENLKNDCYYLAQCWSIVQKKLLETQTPSLIFQELDLPLRILRDFAKYSIKKIYVDHILTEKKITDFIKNFLPNLQSDVYYESKPQKIFERYHLLDQFKSSLQPEVILKSGGSIVIEQTESMTTIDVNTSSFVGKKSHQETILKTNLEAAKLIAYQIQLRGIGGLIVIDFIDMSEESDRLAVYSTLKYSLKNDIMPSHILPMSELGLIQMTRKRTTESFQQKYFTRCSTCKGRGQLVDPQVIALEAFVKLMLLSQKKPEHTIVVISSQAVLNILSRKIKALLEEAPELQLKYRLNIDDDMQPDQIQILTIDV